MACALIAQVAPAVHDLLWTFGVFTFASIQWFPLSFPILLVVMALVLADDVATTKSALRDANTDLELKIAAARQELDELYETKRKADAEAVTVEERHRLMRDMHDGVGTHLSLLLTSLQGRQPVVQGRRGGRPVVARRTAAADRCAQCVDANRRRSAGQPAIPASGAG